MTHLLKMEINRKLASTVWSQPVASSIAVSMKPMNCPLQQFIDLFAFNAATDGHIEGEPSAKQKRVRRDVIWWIFTDYTIMCHFLNAHAQNGKHAVALLPPLLLL